MSDTATVSSSRVTLKLDDDILDIITEQARDAKPGRALLSLAGALLFSLGWLAAKTLKLAFFCCAWAWAAVIVGWRQARGEPMRQPPLEKLLAENDALRKELARITPSMQ